MAFTLHIGPNIRKSPFFEATVAAGVQGFSVYNHMFIPGHFGDPQAEYDRLTNGVAMWDVAAQRQVALTGSDAGTLAQLLTPRALGRMEIGQGRYVPLCDHDGYVINDPVLQKLAEDHYWLSIADSDIALWARAVARERGLDVRVHEPDVSPLAIQGPRAMDVAEALLGDWVRELGKFRFREVELDGIPLLVARSGWSHQDGVELYLRDGRFGTALWDKVAEAGAPFGIGPGAPNDIERLESGLLSYGADIRRQVNPVTPFEVGFGDMVSFEHDFIGKEALQRLAETPPERRRTGLLLSGAPVAGNAHPLPIMQGAMQVGLACEIAHSPRLQRNIGTGFITTGLETADELTVQLPDGARAVTLADAPFA